MIFDVPHLKLKSILFEIQVDLFWKIFELKIIEKGYL